MSEKEKELEELRKLSDPAYSGPGIWHCMHTKASRVNNYNDMVDSIKTIELIIDSLKCSKCKHHATEYNTNHPVRNCLDCKHTNHKGGLERCVFDWTVQFHNAVNHRLGKVIISPDVAWSFYSDSGFEVCNTDCGHDGVNDSHKAPIDKHEAKVVPNASTYFVKGVRYLPR